MSDIPTIARASHAPALARMEVWGLVLFVQIAALGAWWWFMPQGFPVWHSHFWVNSALPWIGILLLVSGVRSLARPSAYRDAVLSMTAGFWAGAAMATIVLFPGSLLKLLPVVPMAVSLSLLAWKSVQRTRGQALAYLAGAMLGAFVLLAQRAPTASTRPSGKVFESPNANLAAGSIERRGAVSFDPAAAVISIGVGGSTVQLQPLLDFHSRSPDRFWTFFAPSRDRMWPGRRLMGVQTQGAQWTAFYQSDFSSRMSVNAENPKVVAVESTAQLTNPIYSHLNSCCDLTITTSRPVSVIFSSCPDSTIAVVEGRPARVSYFAEDGFHVVEAARSNKGPFTELAAGPLRRGEPLSLTFVIDQTPSFRLELQDWSSEVSTELSPTAGWGLPMNAIELWPSGNGCFVAITLAGTSVGTGFDSVGHCAGTYHERMLFELLE